MDLQNEVLKFVEEVDKFRNNHWKKHFPNSKCSNITISEGPMYYKLISDNSVWGFISKLDKPHKGGYIKIGDLLMPASFTAPAKHSRGNIIDSTAKYGPYGPAYLK